MQPRSLLNGYVWLVDVGRFLQFVRTDRGEDLLRCAEWIWVPSGFCSEIFSMSTTVPEAGFSRKREDRRAAGEAVICQAFHVNALPFCNALPCRQAVQAVQVVQALLIAVGRDSQMQRFNCRAKVQAEIQLGDQCGNLGRFFDEAKRKYNVQKSKGGGEEQEEEEVQEDEERRNRRKKKMMRRRKTKKKGTSNNLAGVRVAFSFRKRALHFESQE